MKTLKFTNQINASSQKVWEILWNDETYRKWTAVFHEGSHTESDWNEGSEIRFLGPNGDGMFSIIEKKITGELMIFKHLGEIKNGVKVETDWGRESYELTNQNGITELAVSVESMEEFEEYFATTFPKALEVVKQLSEQN